MNDFTNDRTSGSSDVALAFLETLQQWSATDTSASPHALRNALIGFLRGAQASQPSFAVLHQLAARALDVVDTGTAREDSPADLRAHLERSCKAERHDLLAARDAVARTGTALLTTPEPWIATLSNSGAVREGLLRANKHGRRPRVLVAEGRPNLEGRQLAAALGEAGIPVWLVVDAALPLLISQAQAVWLGADAVTDRGVVNKVGSFALALAAREHSVPVYVFAERKKFLPAETAALRITEMSPDEVWKNPSKGVKPRNVYFELVPMSLVRGIVVEDGVLGPSEASTVARERPLPEELAGV